MKNMDHHILYVSLWIIPVIIPLAAFFLFYSSEFLAEPAGFYIDRRSLKTEPKTY
jgi:hypothetical protein